MRTRKEKKGDSAKKDNLKKKTKKDQKRSERCKN